MGVYNVLHLRAKHKNARRSILLENIGRHFEDTLVFFAC